MNFLRFAVVAPLAIVVVSCGGGGSSTPTSNTPAGNAAPQFTSSAQVEFQENGTGTFYTATASDSDGDSLTFSIDGGSDSARFTLNGTDLSFTETPDFEMPTDADRDNAYELTLRVQDANGGSDTISLTVNVTNNREGIRVTRIATISGTPRAMSPAIAEGEILVFLSNGQTLTIDGQSGAQTGSSQLFTVPNTTLVSAIRTSEGTNGFVQGTYVVGQNPAGEYFVSFHRDGTANRFPDVFTEIISAPTSASPNASITQIDGSNIFHVALGVTQDSDAQNAGSDFGKLYQLLVDPFAGASLRAVSLTASVIGDGIHQPGGAGQIGDQTLLADRGASVEHELNFYPSDARPIDFGWPDREGSQLLTENGPPSLNGPTLVYDFGDTPFTGQGIILGEIYSGPISDLDNSLIFGDLDGSLYSIPIPLLTDGFLHFSEDLERRNADFEPDIGTIDDIIGFTTDSTGNFFILDGDGDIFRIDPA